MSSRIGGGKEPEVARGARPETPEPDALETGGRDEKWLRRHLNALAIIVILAGFVIRLVIAGRSFFNPDEALLSLFSAQKSVFLASKASLGTAHPPLLLILLYFWHFLGNSELTLRLPSVLAGTGLCWFTFKWVEIALSKTAGLVALVLTAFSPVLIGISVELRQYSPLLFFMAAALYYLEAAIQESSPRKMWCFHFFAYSAILTHYSAVFFVLAAGFYALARIADARLPAKTVAAWVAGQLGAAAMYAILYVTQVSKVKDVIPVWAGYLNQFYFRGDFADIFSFLREKTPPIFEYLFAPGSIAAIMLLLWITGIAMLLARLPSRGRAYSRSPLLAFLLLLPFLALWGAVVAGRYPYVPSRHSVFLAPFAIAAVSALLAAIAGQKLWRGLLLAAVLVGLSSASGYSADSFPISRDQRRDLMTAALRYVQESVPRTDPILLDYQSSMVVAHYLCAPEELHGFYSTENDLTPLRCDGRVFAVLNYRTWMLGDKNFPAKFRELVQKFELTPGSRVWVIQTGWRANLDAALEQDPTRFHCLTPKRFGSEIVIIPFVVTPELSAAPAENCEN